MVCEGTVTLLRFKHCTQTQGLTPGGLNVATSREAATSLPSAHRGVPRISQEAKAALKKSF